jgi:hypothetical protein
MTQLRLLLKHQMKSLPLRLLLLRLPLHQLLAMHLRLLQRLPLQTQHWLVTHQKLLLQLLKLLLPMQLLMELQLLKLLLQLLQLLLHHHEFHYCQPQLLRPLLDLQWPENFHR